MKIKLTFTASRQASYSETTVAEVTKTIEVDESLVTVTAQDQIDRAAAEFIADLRPVQKAAKAKAEKGEE